MPNATATPTAVAVSTEATTRPLRLRRMVASGPSCPDCAGPLVFGEGCRVCPVCGFSACA